MFRFVEPGNALGHVAIREIGERYILVRERVRFEQRLYAVDDVAMAQARALWLPVVPEV